ncbi:Disulfide bond formation protein C [Jeotgalicoccus saudimassiliensis]|uniref:Disulfide bond formation protein C n=1 Tax=Jeotgalicoccus saudimassiliensis TaxID=1461582 RepID=A0A078M8Z8_9STAP|nr:disulfide oxidoreductase [Jeotgalicoccus saudimassiliensis]CEA01131.1 Disulfide bond formation protein C [Jeotgalicoccus saudimassiliensis]
MKNNKLYMQMIFIVSLVAMLGSLYFSEIRLYEPCEMCWYQRILMYPIVLLSLIGLVKYDINARLYIRVMSGIGLLVSTYHYALQKIPALGESTNACMGVSCTVQYINWAGFITIPLLALTAFIIIFILSFLIKKN